MTKNCWNDFAASGRVSDYLKYREQEGQKEQPKAALSTGGVEHGTDDRPDRHGAVSHACR